MRTKQFSNNGRLKGHRSSDAELAKLLGPAPADGGNGRRSKSRPKPNGGNGEQRKTQSAPNGEDGAVAGPESSTGVENQPRCGRSATPFASLRACHPAAPNGGNGAWTAFVVTVSPALNGGNGGGVAFVTAMSPESGHEGSVVYVACGEECLETLVLVESACDEELKGSAPLTSCAAPLEACAAPEKACADRLDASAANAERDGRGRFVKGNKGGPGNPFNRRLAAMRKALCKAVTADDIRDLTAHMLAKARDGDLAAMKLVFLYAIGRPSEAVNPDTLDHEEWSLFKSSALPEDLIEITKRLPPSFLCTLFRGASPALARDWVGKLSDMLGVNAPKQAG